MSIRLPSHLYRNHHGGFHFRLVIPRDRRRPLRQREVRFSPKHGAILAALHAAGPGRNCDGPRHVSGIPHAIAGTTVASSPGEPQGIALTTHTIPQHRLRFFIGETRDQSPPASMWDCR